MIRASVAVAVLSLAACSRDAKTCNDEEPIYYQDPLEERQLALDESWIALRDGIVRGVEEDDATGPEIVAPEDGATIAKEGWEYRWQLAAEARFHREPRRPRSTWGELGQRVLAFLSPIGTAHAHGAPVTGNVFLLELFLPGERCPVKVVTAGLGPDPIGEVRSWPVDDATLEKVTEEEEVDARVTSAFLDENVLGATEPVRRRTLHRVTVEP